jgi:hypothetical protein
VFYLDEDCIVIPRSQMHLVKYEIKKTEINYMITLEHAVKLLLKLIKFKNIKDFFELLKHLVLIEKEKTINLLLEEANKKTKDGRAHGHLLLNEDKKLLDCIYNINKDTNLLDFLREYVLSKFSIHLNLNSKNKANKSLVALLKKTEKSQVEGIITSYDLIPSIVFQTFMIQCEAVKKMDKQHDKELNKIFVDLYLLTYTKPVIPCYMNDDDKIKHLKYLVNGIELINKINDSKSMAKIAMNIIHTLAEVYKIRVSQKIDTKGLSVQMYAKKLEKEVIRYFIYNNKSQYKKKDDHFEMVRDSNTLLMIKELYDKLTDDSLISLFLEVLNIKELIEEPYYSVLRFLIERKNGILEEFKWKSEIKINKFKNQFVSYLKQSTQNSKLVDLMLNYHEVFISRLRAISIMSEENTFLFDDQTRNQITHLLSKCCIDKPSIIYKFCNQYFEEDFDIVDDTNEINLHQMLKKRLFQIYEIYKDWVVFSNEYSNNENYELIQCDHKVYELMENITNIKDKQIEIRVEKQLEGKYKELTQAIESKKYDYDKYCYGFINNVYHKSDNYYHDKLGFDDFTKSISILSKDNSILKLFTNSYYLAILFIEEDDSIEEQELTFIIVGYLKGVEQMLSKIIGEFSQRNIIHSHIDSYDGKTEIKINSKNWLKKTSISKMHNFIEDIIIDNLAEANKLTGSEPHKILRSLDLWIKNIRNDNLHNDNLFKKETVTTAINESYNVIFNLVVLAHHIFSQ